ncbi:MAG: hypothetical protein WAR37_03490 [Candidatus Microsaccharimonas sp.]
MNTMTPTMSLTEELGKILDEVFAGSDSLIKTDRDLGTHLTRVAMSRKMKYSEVLYKLRDILANRQALNVYPRRVIEGFDPTLRQALGINIR